MAEKLVRLEEMLQEQQAELASLRVALAQKQTNRAANKSVPATTTPPVPVPGSPIKPPDSSRRQMLKRMGLAVLAGGAALGLTSAPAEARLSINPSSNSNVGVVITRNGASMTGIPATPNIGLIVSADDSLNVGAVGVPGSPIGVCAISNLGTSSIGVYGYSPNGVGVRGNNSTGTGVVGQSLTGTGVSGLTSTAAQPGVNAKNLASTSGIALQIEQGGLTMTGAGVATETAAFIHQTSIVNLTINGSKIDNPLCNGRQDALLFVTHNNNPTGSPVAALTHSIGVVYASNFWNIYLEDGTTIPHNLYFNVLIINP